MDIGLTRDVWFYGCSKQADDWSPLMNELKHVNGMSGCTDEWMYAQMFVLNE